MKNPMSQSGQSLTDRTLRLAFLVWLTASGLFVLSNGALLLVRGPADFGKLIQEGSLSFLPLTLAAVACVWIGVGASLGVLRSRDFRGRYGLTVACALIVLILYSNLVRERTQYGDVSNYIEGVQSLVDHVPLDSSYLYPPFLATILGPFLPLGEQGLQVILGIANVLAVCLFFLLLTSSLQQYGCEYRSSHLLALAFLMLNVPVLRTIYWGQVNLHVANLVLVSLLYHKRTPIASAFALALAAHLKVAPLVLALPFLLGRNWRWAIWFAAALIVLAGVTVVPYGWRPFLDVMNNIRNIYSLEGMEFRETSVDSLFRSVALLLQLPWTNVTRILYVAKGCVLAASLGVTLLAVKRESFVKHGQKDASVYNAFPILMVFMVLASPTVWEHYGVLVALPYLLVLMRISTASEIVLFVFAYLLEYLLPTFDFFPWSFGRLLSPLILLGIVYMISRRPQTSDISSALAAFLGETAPQAVTQVRPN